MMSTQNEKNFCFPHHTQTPKKKKDYKAAIINSISLNKDIIIKTEEFDEHVRSCPHSIHFISQDFYSGGRGRREEESYYNFNSSSFAKNNMTGVIKPSRFSNFTMSPFNTNVLHNKNNNEKNGRSNSMATSIMQNIFLNNNPYADFERVEIKESKVDKIHSALHLNLKEENTNSVLLRDSATSPNTQNKMLIEEENDEKIFLITKVYNKMKKGDDEHERIEHVFYKSCYAFFNSKNSSGFSYYSIKEVLEHIIKESMSYY